ncbi:unnamed protein product [Gadus morhua 'NCC']
MRPQLIPVGHRVGPLGDRGAIGRLVDIGAGNTGNTRRQWCWEHWETMVLLEHWETVVLETLGDSGAGNTGRQWYWKHWETVVLETLGTLKDSAGRGYRLFCCEVFREKLAIKRKPMGSHRERDSSAGVSLPPCPCLLGRHYCSLSQHLCPPPVPPSIPVPSRPPGSDPPPPAWPRPSSMPRRRLKTLWGHSSRNAVI